jgi:hypothetical protein
MKRLDLLSKSKNARTIAISIIAIITLSGSGLGE